jgi:hypothetical protein
MHALAQLIDGYAAGIRGRAEEPRLLRIDPWICLCPSHVVNSYRSRCKCSIALWCVVLGYNTVCAIIIHDTRMGTCGLVGDVRASSHKAARLGRA